ncbi:hypothetical protein DV738_g3623, partial [Chaetothyriales sp. CBS 135597]
MRSKMPLKQAGLAKAYSCLQCTISSQAPAGAATSSWKASSTCSPHSAKRQKVNPYQWRSYRTARPRRPFEFRDNLNWPCHRTPHSENSSTIPPRPTPYEIFDIRPSGVYSKRQFYELVKMYHPDRHAHHVRLAPDHPIATLPRLERLERYRLVVRAHEILSDPAKRQAYDASGAGWDDHSSDTATRARARARARADTDADSCFENATWEDWERWYARTAHPEHAQGPQAYGGNFFNPNLFASLVIVLAVISGIFQATHVSQFSGTIEERAIAFTAQTQQFLRERRSDNSRYQQHAGPVGHHHDAGAGNMSGRGGSASGGRSSSVVEERIKHFLERRDPCRSGLKDDEVESYRQPRVKKTKVDVDMAPD